MEKLTYKDIIYIAITILLFPMMYYAPLYMKYKDINTNMLNKIKHEKVVIIYDNFNISHGELITEIFTNNTKGEYEILRLDQTDVRVETLSLVVKNLIDQNKQVYINASVNPNKGLYSSIWKNIFNELAEIDKVKITQSIINPAVGDFLEIISDDNAIDFQLADIAITDQAKCANLTLQASGLRSYGIIVVGIKKKNNELIFAPSPSDKIEVGDRLIALGSGDSLSSILAEQFS